MNKPQLTLVTSAKTSVTDSLDDIRRKTPRKSPVPPLTGSFRLGSDGTTFLGYIDIGDERINCMLSAQKDPSILKLEEFLYEAPTGTGIPFWIGEPSGE
jgi:hypothetical protein